MSQQSRNELIPEIISEFSQVFAAARTRWAKYADEVHPELRGPGLMMLRTIMRHEPITATGLAGLMGLDKAAVSRQVTRLRQLGLIDATPAESDKRVVLLSASEAGRTALDGSHAFTAEAYRARFADWDTEQLRQLHGLLHMFNEGADAQRGDGPARRCARTKALESEA